MEKAFQAKRLWVAITTIFLSLLCAVYLVACDNDMHTHSYANYVYNNDATCVEDGTETGKCKYCDKTDTRKSESHPATGKHNYKEYVCLSCGDLKPDAPYTEGLEYTEIKDNEQTVGYSVSSGNARMANYIKIPSEYEGLPVTTIGKMGFFNCVNLARIIIPSSVTHIDDYSFLSNYSLIRIDIPNSVTSIGERAFSDCSRLRSIEIPNSVTSVGFDAFNGCWKLQLNEYKNGLYLGNSGNPYHALISIKNQSVSTIEVNDNTKVIADVVFNGCWGLQSVKMSNSVTTIGNRAFYMCRELKSIDMPNTLEIIGEQAFFACMNLTSITIPSSVTSIGDCAFLGCDLKSITFNGTQEQWEVISKSDAWNSDSSIKTIVCTDGTITL